MPFGAMFTPLSSQRKLDSVLWNRTPKSIARSVITFTVSLSLVGAENAGCGAGRGTQNPRGELWPLWCALARMELPSVCRSDTGEPGAQDSRVQGCRPTGLGLLSRGVCCQSHSLWPEGWLALPTVSWKESHLSGSICPQPPRLLSRQPSRLPLLGLRVTLGTVILCLLRNVLCLPQAQPVAQNVAQGR